MPNLVDVTYAQTGESTRTNAMGMREMQTWCYNAAIWEGWKMSENKSYVVWNNKGGVGKSTITFHIASTYAETHTNEGDILEIMHIPVEDERKLRDDLQFLKKLILLPWMGTEEGQNGH